MKQVAGNTPIKTLHVVKDINLIDGEAIERIWYRLKGESNTAYNYFKLYLTMSMPRSIGRAAIKARVERTTLANYSAKHKWLERAAAFDDFNTEIELDKKRRQRESKDLEWSARRDEQREAEWNIAQELLDKVRQMLRVPLFKETIEETLEGLDPSGRIIIRQIIINEPLDWSAVDIARFFDVAAKMARLATGMATDRKQIKINVSAMSDEELEQLANDE